MVFIITVGFDNYFITLLGGIDYNLLDFRYLIHNLTKDNPISCIQLMGFFIQNGLKNIKFNDKSHDK